MKGETLTLKKIPPAVKKILMRVQAEHQLKTGERISLENLIYMFIEKKI